MDRFARRTEGNALGLETVVMEVVAVSADFNSLSEKGVIEHLVSERTSILGPADVAR